MGTGSRPSPDRGEVERLLHLLRSTLARLKAEIELADRSEDLGDAFDAATEAIEIVDSLQHLVNAGAVLVIVLDDDLRLAELTAQKLLRVGIEARAGRDFSVLRDLDPATVQLLVDLTLLRSCDAKQLSTLSKFHFVVMTGAVTNLARIEAQGYGASGYLVKPFTAGQVLNSLGRSTKLPWL